MGLFIMAGCSHRAREESKKELERAVYEVVCLFVLDDFVFRR